MPGSLLRSLKIPTREEDATDREQHVEHRWKIALEPDAGKHAYCRDPDGDGGDELA